jgi:hypothetical protein
VPFHAPNGFVYANKKAYLKSLKAMHFYSSVQKPNSSKKSKRMNKRKREIITLKNIKYQKILSNNIGTASNTEDIKVLDSWEERESRRKFQNNVIHIEDDDANVRIDIIDRENKLKPKKAKNIITEEYQGDKIITEYGADKKKVAEMHIQISNIRPIDTDRSPKQLSKLSMQFEDDLNNLDTAQIKSHYDLAILRVLGQKVYNTGKSPRVKDEKLWYIRNIRSVRAERQMQERSNKGEIYVDPDLSKRILREALKKKQQIDEKPKFGDITKIK